MDTGTEEQNDAGDPKSTAEKGRGGAQAWWFVHHNPLVRFDEGVGSASIARAGHPALPDLK
jgi:hypothetical protein